MADTLPDLLTTAEIADLYRVTPATVSKWARAGILRSYRIAGQKEHRFSRAEVEAALTPEVLS